MDAPVDWPETCLSSEDETMKIFLRMIILPAMLLLCGTAFAAQISIRIGPPPPNRIERVRPPQPGRDYVWVNGYWYPVNNRWTWHQGYWTRPPYPGAHWVEPRHERAYYYNGYWEGDRGRVEHNHGWDSDRDRDWKHDHYEHTQ